MAQSYELQSQACINPIFGDMLQRLITLYQSYIWWNASIFFRETCESGDKIHVKKDSHVGLVGCIFTLHKQFEWQVADRVIY